MPTAKRMTPQEYLEFEKRSELRHEYVNGELRSMAGDKKQNNRVVGRLYRLLAAAAETKGYEVFLQWSKCKWMKTDTAIPTWW